MDSIWLSVSLQIRCWRELLASEGLTGKKEPLWRGLTPMAVRKRPQVLTMWASSNFSDGFPCLHEGSFYFCLRVGSSREKSPEHLRQREREQSSAPTSSLATNLGPVFSSMKCRWTLDPWPLSPIPEFSPLMLVLGKEHQALFCPHRVYLSYLSLPWIFPLIY